MRSAPEAQPGDPTDRRYRQAALGYLVLGSLVVLVTLATPEMLGAARRADLAHLLVGIPIFALFAALVAWGDRPVAGLVRLFDPSRERAAAWGRQAREKLVMLLTVTSLVRAVVLTANAAGVRPRLTAGGLALEPVAAPPRLWLACALMALVVWLLGRASWGAWWTRRRGDGGSRHD